MLTLTPHIASTAGESLDEVVSAAADDAASIAGSTTPLLNFDSDLAVSQAAVRPQEHFYWEKRTNHVYAG